jgi:hypothetical protein
MLESKAIREIIKGEKKKKKKKKAQTHKRTTYLRIGRKLKVEDKRSLAGDKNT